MLEHVPAFLGRALKNVRAGHGKLAVARLGADETLGAGGFTLRSPAFEDGEPLDPMFTADEEDACAPPLAWSATPTGTEELVLLVEDPDAPGVEPFVHLIGWGIEPSARQLLEGEDPPKVGRNSSQKSEWLAPDPPTGHGPHAYVFQLFAIDTPLDLQAGAGRGALVEAMQGHVLAAAVLTGTYARED